MTSRGPRTMRCRSRLRGSCRPGGGSPSPGPVTSRPPSVAPAAAPGRPAAGPSPRCSLLRRSAGAVTAVIVGIVLPYLLAVVPGVLPASAAAWLVRVSPAAAFAIQQSVPQYAQVTSNYSPSTGYFPLAPWAGFAVLCAWAAAALGLALFLLRRRDA